MDTPFSNIKISHMRGWSSALCAGAIALSISSLHGAEVYSVPQGVVAIEIPAATNATTPSITPIGLSLFNPPVYSGAVTAVTSNTITDSNAAFGDLSTVGNQHYIKVTSGTAAGRLFLISSNTGTSLTVALGTPTVNVDATGIAVAAGDHYQIIPADTLGSLFGEKESEVVLKTGSDANEADNVVIWDDEEGGYVAFFNDGENWFLAGGFPLPQNDRLIPLDNGMLIVHRDTNPLSIFISGQVPSSVEKTQLPKRTLISNRFPVDTTLKESKINEAPGWVSSTDFNVADTLAVWLAEDNGWVTYYHDGSNWFTPDFPVPQDDAIIKSNSAVFILRAGDAPVGSNSFMSQKLPYSLN